MADTDNSLVDSWEVIVRARLFPEYLFLPFLEVILTAFLLAENGILWKYLAASLLRVLTGLALGSITGIGLGILMSYREKVHRALHPIFSLLMPIPILGWLHLFVLWIGINEALPILLIFICSFFPVLYNTISGIRSADRSYVEIARSLVASERRTFLDIVIPLALQNIITGMRLEAGMAWRTIVATEMIAISVGIGFLLINSQYLLRVDVIMVCLGVLAIMSLLFERMLLWVERKSTKWR